MQRFGDYLLVSVLGRGGMAEVFRARRFGPAGFERSVVVKRIRDVYTRDAAFVQLFVNEAKVAAQLSHPNIVQVYDFGEVDGEYFIAMEYVRGKDLLWLVRHLRRTSAEQLGRLPAPVVAFVMREVCRGLAHAHGQLNPTGQPAPIIHRDVSPQNIMMTYDGQVKLVDFGIAKALLSAQHEDTRGAFKGKYAYMSPEQAAGQPVGPASDLFGAGIVMHEALTGYRLFRGESDLDTVNRVRSAVIRPPSALAPDVPPALDRIVVKALERDLVRRYDRAAAMARDLDDYLRDVHFTVEQLAEWMSATVPHDERDLTNDSQALFSGAPPAPAPISLAGRRSPGEPAHPIAAGPAVRAGGGPRRLLMGLGILLVAAVVGSGAVAVSVMRRSPAPRLSAPARGPDPGAPPPIPAPILPASAAAPPPVPGEADAVPPEPDAAVPVPVPASVEAAQPAPPPAPETPAAAAPPVEGPDGRDARGGRRRSARGGASASPSKRRSRSDTREAAPPLQVEAFD